MYRLWVHSLREPTLTLADLLADGASDIHAVAGWLDGLSHADRLVAMSSTSKAQQRRLWELAEASAPMGLDDLVPDGVSARTEVIHHGRNTLPVLRSFEKRFCRPEAGEDRLFGYNEGLTRPIVGPGYFVAHPTAGNAEWEARGAIVVDYFMVPDAAVAEGWPTVVPNSRGIQVLVYHHTRDFMRRISEHVSIGIAYKNEMCMNNWFTLVREDVGL